MWVVGSAKGIFCALAAILLEWIVAWGVIGGVIVPMAGAIEESMPVLVPLVFLLLMSLLCQIVTMFTDPGAIPNFSSDALQTQSDRKETKRLTAIICRIWQWEKTTRVHHCSTCNRCIERMDHHCPWVNNWIGYYNQKHFLLYLIYTYLGLIFSAVLLTVYWTMCDEGGPECEAWPDVVFLSTCIVMVFIPFITYVLYTQIRAVLSGTSGIDEL